MMAGSTSVSSTPGLRCTKFVALEDASKDNDAIKDVLNGAWSRTWSAAGRYKVVYSRQDNLSTSWANARMIGAEGQPFEPTAESL